jgi:hypothetical protein
MGVLEKQNMAKPIRQETTEPSTSEPEGVEVVSEKSPNEIYREKFNVIAKRLDRQLVALQKLSGARKAAATDDQREKALAWLERRVSVTIAAMHGLKLTPNDSGIL